MTNKKVEQTPAPEPQQLDLGPWLNLIGRQTLQIDQLSQEVMMLRQQLAKATETGP